MPPGSFDSPIQPVREPMLINRVEHRPHQHPNGRQHRHADESDQGDPDEDEITLSDEFNSSQAAAANTITPVRHEVAGDTPSLHIDFEA